uniref:Uncharacterized protein n=1 Tax=Rhizophora mucronata TaxID=61149 RepID=A0A2P2JAP2_RHIMU
MASSEGRAAAGDEENVYGANKIRPYGSSPMAGQVAEEETQGSLGTLTKSLGFEGFFSLVVSVLF